VVLQFEAYANANVVAIYSRKKKLIGGGAAQSGVGS